MLNCDGELLCRCYEPELSRVGGDHGIMGLTRGQREGTRNVVGFQDNHSAVQVVRNEGLDGDPQIQLL